MNTKLLTRQNARELRNSFDSIFIEEASKKACKIISSTPIFTHASTVLMYFPINNEISPLFLLEIALSQGKKVAFPVCDHQNNTLIFREIQGLDELTRSKFGLLEPLPTCKEIEMDENTLCLVPALAFSRNGSRIGYGKGFYDKFLKDFKGISLGISYSQLLFDKIPSENHDVPVNMIVTEREVIIIDKEN